MKNLLNPTDSLWRRRNYFVHIFLYLHLEICIGAEKNQIILSLCHHRQKLVDQRVNAMHHMGKEAKLCPYFLCHNYTDNPANQSYFDWKEAVEF